ncbi:MAG: hypothetical protein ACRC1P_09945 [Cellulosilyticaceae bacterium]
MEMSMRDVKILMLLNKEDKTTPFKSLKFDDIWSKYTSSSNANISESSLRRNVKVLMEHGYIEYGFKMGSIKTYYITSLGIELLSAIK